MSDQGMIAATIKHLGHLDFVTHDDGFQATRHELSMRSIKAYDDHRSHHTQSAADQRASLTKAELLARASEKVAREMNTTFHCAGGVQTALASIGMSSFEGCGDAWQMGAVLQRSGKFQVVPESEARRGDIGVQAWSESTVHNYYKKFHGQNLGDIFVVQDNKHGHIYQTNDHPQPFDPHNRLYDPTKRYFLRILDV